MVDVRVGAVVHKGHRPVDLAGDLDLDLVAVGRAYDVGVLSGSRRGKGGGRKRNRGRAEQGRLEAGHRENLHTLDIDSSKTVRIDHSRTVATPTPDGPGSFPLRIGSPLKSDDQQTV